MIKSVAMTTLCPKPILGRETAATDGGAEDRVLGMRLAFVLLVERLFVFSVGIHFEYSEMDWPSLWSLGTNNVLVGTSIHA